MLNTNELTNLNRVLDESPRFAGAFDDLLEDFDLRETVYENFEY